MNLIFGTNSQARCMMYKAITFLLFVACNMSCSVQGENIEEVLPEAPCVLGKTLLSQNDYFPISIGDTLEYQYLASSHFLGFSPIQESGLLEWQVKGVECNEENAGYIYTINEYREGVRRFIHNERPQDSMFVETERILTVMQDSAGFLSFPYTDGQLKRFYGSAEDTLLTFARNLKDNLIPNSAGCSTHGSTIKLVRNQGIYAFESGCGYASTSKYLEFKLLG